MMRADINNELLSLFEDPSYLEVGVWKGDTFRDVRAKQKVAVDPGFQFNYRTPEANQNGELYYEVISNAYFAQHDLNRTKFDLIFLDGLHTFEQTLTDLLHAMDRTKQGGIIVIDDVMPDSYPASMRSEAECFRFRTLIKDPSTHWMGDVYKLVFFLNSFMLNWTYYTVEETHGQVVMWRAPRLAGHSDAELAVQICGKSYSDTVLSRRIFNIRPFAEILTAARERSG